MVETVLLITIHNGVDNARIICNDTIERTATGNLEMKAFNVNLHAANIIGFVGPVGVTGSINFESVQILISHFTGQTANQSALPISLSIYFFSGSVKSNFISILQVYNKKLREPVL